MIPWWLIGTVVAVTVVAVAARRKKLVALPLGDLLALFPPPENATQTGDREYDGAGQWQLTANGKCPRADALLIPTTDELGIPQAAITAGGPIAAVIKGGIDVVNAITNQLGWKRRCAVRGGQYVLLEIVQAQLVRAWVHIEIALEGHPPAAAWVFDDEVGSTGEVTNRSAAIVLIEPDYTQSEAWYLRHGGAPPAHWWPHGMGVQKYVHLLEHPKMTSPRIEAIRTDNDLRIYAWLPPRVPSSHLNAWGKRIVDEPSTWRVEWSIAAA